MMARRRKESSTMKQLHQNIHKEDEYKELLQLQPFGSKASMYIQESNAFVNLAVGSIRSGKTIAVIFRFIQHVLHSPHNLFAIAGNTVGALKQNVLHPIQAILNAYGIPNEYKSYDNILYIKNNEVKLYGVDKSGSDRKIKGSTFGGALLDEVTIMDKEGVHMLISRNSLSGARIFMTCNPDNPNNFIYKEYVSNTSLSEADYKGFTFQLEDNSTLTPEYIEHIKSIYPPESIFYKRNILGQWASGQGLIYSRFDDNNIYTEDRPLSYYDYLEFGSDYGAGSTTCWNLVGVKYFEDHIEYDIIDEGGHNAEDEGYSLTDSEIVDLICDMQDYYHLDLSSTFYPSHDAKSLKTELEKNERVRMHIQTFTPDTLECIGEISSLFYKNYIRVHERCKRTIDCIRGYEWDVNMARKGKDVPHKVDDHFCDSIRAPIINHLYTDSGIGGYIDW